MLLLWLSDLVVLDWSLGFRVLSGVGNDRRISFDGGLIHWDFLLFLLLLLSLLGWLLLIVLLVLLIMGFLILLLSFLIALLLFILLLFSLLGFLFLFFGFFLGWCGLSGVSCLSILLHILGQRLNQVIREARLKLHSLALLDIGGSQQSSNHKC